MALTIKGRNCNKSVHFVKLYSHGTVMHRLGRYPD
jgi:hypothetical protein